MICFINKNKKNNKWSFLINFNKLVSKYEVITTSYKNKFFSPLLNTKYSTIKLIVIFQLSRCKYAYYILLQPNITIYWYGILKQLKTKSGFLIRQNITEYTDSFKNTTEQE